MMQRITLAVIAMAMTLLSGAQQVENCKAGQLATLVDDCICRYFTAQRLPLHRRLAKAAR